MRQMKISHHAKLPFCDHVLLSMPFPANYPVLQTAIWVTHHTMSDPLFTFPFHILENNPWPAVCDVYNRKTHFQIDSLMTAYEKEANGL